jgi:hypothetical protein
MKKNEENLRDFMKKKDEVNNAGKVAEADEKAKREQMAKIHLAQEIHLAQTAEIQRAEMAKRRAAIRAIADLQTQAPIQPTIEPSKQQRETQKEAEKRLYGTTDPRTIQEKRKKTISNIQRNTSAKVTSKDLFEEGKNDFDTDDSEAFTEPKEKRHIPRQAQGTKKVGGSARSVPSTQHSKKRTQSNASDVCMCKQLNLITEKDQPCRKICKPDDRRCKCGAWMGASSRDLHAMTSKKGWNAWKCQKCKRKDAVTAKEEKGSPLFFCISSCRLCAYRKSHRIDDSHGH